MAFGRLLLWALLTALLMLPSETLATTPEESYWISKLPNVPMPESFHDNIKPLGIVLPSDDEVESYVSRTYFDSKLKHDDPLAELSLFFLEKNLHVGDAISLRVIEKTNQAVFLPRTAVRSAPLLSQGLEEILHRFSLKVHSPEAYEIEHTLEECKKKFFKNETRECETSLESMVDFATTWVGKEIEVVSTTTTGGKHFDSKRETYIINKRIERVEGDMLVACHKLNWPYALYKCHAFTPSQAHALKVPLKGSDGDEVFALAVCHNYDYIPYWLGRPLAEIVVKKLKLRPGIDPICHFIAKDAVLWKLASQNN